MQKWSHSLDVTARTCERRVFYMARYASPTATKGSPRYEAFLLNQALDPDAWRGRLVHAIISQLVVPALARGERFTSDKVETRVSAIIDRQVGFSRSGRYRQVSKNAAKDDYCVLRSDLMGEGSTKQEVDQVHTEVFAALKVLENEHSELLMRIRRARWRLAEEEIRFRLDDQILVEAIPDLIFAEPGGRIVIVDWKVWQGDRSNARDQLHAYAFTVVNCGRWPAILPDRLELIEANLLTGEAITYAITDDELDLVDERIFLGSERLRPIFARMATQCSPDEFAPATSPAACLTCPMKEICNARISAKPAQEQILFKLFPA